MSDDRYTLDVPFMTIPGLYVSVSGLTKEQVIDMTRARIKDGIYPNRELLEFIIETQSLEEDDATE